jgi:Flp pilus assembly protein TadG
MVEFALVAPILLLLLGATIDFGLAYSKRLEVANAARVGARWASLHSGDFNQGWSSSATPADNTIQGQVLYSGDTLSVINNSSHIQIKYFVWTPGTTTTIFCGRYDQPTNAFVGAPKAGSGTYALTECVAVGNIVQVTVLYDYPPLTPFISQFATFPVGSSASFVIQS